MLGKTRNKFERLIKLDFVRFCIVGGLGFVINFVLLIGLMKFFGLPVEIAQLIGAEVALGTNFILHHNWTYKKHHVNKSLKSLIIQFHATTWPAILGSTIMVSISVEVFHMNKFLALVISSLVSLGWNFAWSKFVVWRDVTPEEVEDIAK